MVESPRRAVYRITERGTRLLRDTPETDRVDLRLLSAFAEYRQFRSQDGADGSTTTTAPEVAETTAGTPHERMASAWHELRAALAVDVLDRVREQTPLFFERVVLEVLRAIGYGGSREDAAERLGRSGDGGLTPLPTGALT